MTTNHSTRIECDTVLTEKEKNLLIDITVHNALEAPENKKKRTMYLTILLILAAVCIVWNVVRYQQTHSVLNLVVIMIWVIFAIVGLLSKSIQEKQIRNKLQQAYQSQFQQEPNQTIHIVVTDENVAVKSPRIDTSYDWDQFVGYGESGNYLYLLLKDNNYVLIDTSVLKEEERHQLYDLVINKDISKI